MPLIPRGRSVGSDTLNTWILAAVAGELRHSRVEILVERHENWPPKALYGLAHIPIPLKRQKKTASCRYEMSNQCFIPDNGHVVGGVPSGGEKLAPQVSYWWHPACRGDHVWWHTACGGDHESAPARKIEFETGCVVLVAPCLQGGPRWWHIACGG